MKNACNYIVVLETDENLKLEGRLILPLEFEDGPLNCVVVNQIERNHLGRFGVLVQELKRLDQGRRNGLHFETVLRWTFRFRFLRRVPPCGGGTFGGMFTAAGAGGTTGTGGMAGGDFTSVTNIVPPAET